MKIERATVAPESITFAITFTGTVSDLKKIQEKLDVFYGPVGALKEGLSAAIEDAQMRFFQEVEEKPE